MQNNYLTPIVIGLLGILLIAFEGRGDLMTWAVIVVGIMFIVPGLYVLISQLAAKQGRSSSSIIAAVGCLCLGACLCIIPQVFVSILIYVFAFTLIFFGVAQIVQVADFKLPMGFYIVPALVAIAGVVMVFIGAKKDASVIVLITGISMVLYSINSLVERYRINKYLKESGTAK